MSRDTWNPEQYHRFRQYRRRPWEDLRNGINRRENMRVVDLGCGSGELTAELHQWLGAAETLGIDSSGAMLEQAREHSTNAVSFEQREIVDFVSDESQHGQWDVVISNSALHWLEAHHSIWPQLAELLADGGQLAVQIPANHKHPSHTTATAVAMTKPFVGELEGWTFQSNVLEPESYAHLLFDMGFEEPRVELRVYPQQLDSRDQVIEWVKGSLLTAYEKRLSPEFFEQFVERYRQVLLARLPDQKPFFYPYNRILQWATKS